MTYFAPPGPRILAHRGLALEAPENTLAAFEAAARVGVTHIETDAHVTADGIAVLWHDPDLRRWDGSGDEVGSLTAAQLAVRRARGHRIPSLTEALTELPQLHFNIDVKTPTAARTVVRAVDRARAHDRVLLTSFSERTARALRQLAPAATHGAATERVALALAGIQLRSRALLSRALAAADAVQLPLRAAGIDLVTPPRLEWWHRYVREVHVWTINEPEQQLDLLRRGVDGIVTDRCDIGMRVLRDYLAE